jgi:hypothetical protein
MEGIPGSNAGQGGVELVGLAWSGAVVAFLLHARTYVGEDILGADADEDDAERPAVAPTWSQAPWEGTEETPWIRSG